MRSRSILIQRGLIATAIAGGIGLVGCGSPPPRVEPPPPKVSVAKPEVRQIVDFDQYNGWLKPVETVEVRARVRGHIDKIHFTDGDVVQKGEVLFELDPRPFQAEIDRAQEQVKIYQAQAVAATKDEKRLRDLVTKGGASQSQVDAAEAESKSLEAQIESTKQEVTRKGLDLEYARITAPITGRVGRAMLTTGNLVNAGGSDPVLTTIVSVDPIHVYFDVDERSIQRYAKSRTGTTRPASIREAKVPFRFRLESEDGFPHEGVLDFANNQVDATTGTIQVRGIVPNPGATFVPGSRVQIRVPVSAEREALLVPDTAVLSDQDKKYVLAVDEKNVVHRCDVELGKLLDDGSRIIRAGGAAAAGGGAPTTAPTAGITADNWIITQGIQMARVNYPVEPIRPTTQPATQPVAAAR